jgi:hypothetical protein
MTDEKDHEKEEEQPVFACPHTQKREITTAGYGKKVFCMLCNQQLA